MTTRMDLDRLGAAFDERWAAAHADRARELELVRQLVVEDEAPRAGRTVRGIAVAAAAVLVAGGALWMRPAPAVSFTVDGHAVSPGAYLGAADRTTELVFSEGSRASLEPGSRGRVTGTTAVGARILLESGTARLDVEHRDQTAWELSAGPFGVHVIGTTFAVDWSPSGGALSVTVEEGLVRVDGPLLSEGHPVAAGQTLQVSLPTRMVVIRDAGAEPAAPEPPATEPPALTPVSAPTSAESSDAAQPTAPGAASPGPDWRALARREDYARAFAAARPRWDRLCRRATPADLLRLADVARFSGHAPEARRALEAVRQRHPNTAHAVTAAFTLGRLAAASGDPKAAVRWFEVVADEEKRGSLHRAALARLLEAHVRAGRRDEARRVATEYLRAYPEGPQAALAREWRSR